MSIRVDDLENYSHVPLFGEEVTRGMTQQTDFYFLNANSPFS